MTKESLTVVDNRTGKSYELPIEYNAIRTKDLRQIKQDEKDFGLLGYDPGFTNTASCKSGITFIDGDEGILEYRGYPIEQLAEHCSFLETTYLILFGELPSRAQLQEWTREVMSQATVHEAVRRLIQTFPPAAHPMSIFTAAVASLSAYYPEARKVKDKSTRRQQIVRLIAKVPAIVAYIYRHRHGLPVIYPDPQRDYIENFLHMLWADIRPEFAHSDVLARAVTVLLILHLDHEQNCSSTVMRAAGSSLADPYLCAAAAAAALSGPLHGGANEAVIRMLEEIGSVENIAPFIESVKKGERRLMGFGHRVYKNYDPRARIIKQIAHEVFGVTGKNPLLDIAVALEEVALREKYFVERRLYPNVDFYSGIIYQAMGFPPEMFTVLFAFGRTAGWLAQWQEMLEDPEQKIARPRQIYIGHRNRKFVPIEERSQSQVSAKI